MRVEVPQVDFEPGKDELIAQSAEYFMRMGEWLGRMRLHEE